MTDPVRMHKHVNSVERMNIPGFRFAALKSLARYALSTSVLALLIGAPAWAVNECGLDTAGQSTNSCTNSTYGNGIEYYSSDGLTLNFSTPGTVVTGGGGVPLAGIELRDTANSLPVGPGTNGDLIVDARNVSSITGVRRGAFIRKQGVVGNAAITLEDVAIQTIFGAPGSFGAAIYMAPGTTGDASITMNGGSILTDGTSSAGLNITHAGASGNVNMVITDVDIETRGIANPGANAMIANRDSFGDVSLTATNVTLITRQGSAGNSTGGLFSQTIGEGNASIEVTDSSIETRGVGNIPSSGDPYFSLKAGISALVGNADGNTNNVPQNFNSQGLAHARVSNTTVSTGDMIYASAISAFNWAMGGSVVEIDNVDVTTSGQNSSGVTATAQRHVNNASPIWVTVNNSRIATQNTTAAGVVAFTVGSGTTTIEMTGLNEVETFGSNNSAAVTARSRGAVVVDIRGAGSTYTANGSDASGIWLRNGVAGAGSTTDLFVGEDVTVTGGTGAASAGIELDSLSGNTSETRIESGAIIDGDDGRAGFWDKFGHAELISAGEIIGGTAVGSNVSLVGVNAPNSLLAIDAGAGNDTISLIMNSDTSGAVHTGTGDDAVSVGSNLQVPTATLVGNIITAVGADEVNLLGGSDVTGSVLTGDGNDIVRTGNTFVTTAPPSGTLGGSALLSNGIDTGGGDDSIAIRNGSTIGITSAIYGLSTGAGNDTFSISSTSTTELARLSGGINTGSGDDSGRLGDNSVVSGDVLMANGSDELVITGGADITAVTAIDGGDDVSPADGWVDVLHLDGGTRSFDGGDLTNWETVNLRNNADIAFSGSDLVTGGSANNGPSGLPHGLTVQSGSFARFDGSFTVDGNLNNAGTVDLSLDGAVGTRVNVTSDYVGTAGSSLLIDVSLDDGGLDNLPATDVIRSDLLHVAGDASGTTNVFVTNLGGLGNYTDLNQNDAVENNEGILFAQVEGNSTAGLFALGGPVTVGAFTYDLVAFDPATSASGFWDYVLANRFSNPTFSYETYPRAVMFTMPTLHQRVGNRHWTGVLQPEIAATEIFCKDPEQNFRCTITEEQAAYYDDQKLIEEDAGWIRVVGSRAFVAPTFSTVGVDGYNVETLEIQAGIDQLLREDDEGNKWIGGLNAQISTSGVAGNDPTGDASMKATALGIGGTLTYYQPNGFYTDLQARIMGVSTDFESATSGSYDNARAVVLSASAEVGRKYELDNGWRVVPQAQLTYTQARFRSFTDSAGAVVNPDNAESLKLRVGVAVGRETAWQAEDGTTRRLEVEAGLHLHEELAGRTRVTVSGTPLYNKEDDTTAEITLGATYNWNNDQNSVYGEIGVQTGLRNFGRSHRVSGTLGFRRRWD